MAVMGKYNKIAAADKGISQGCGRVAPSSTWLLRQQRRPRHSRAVRFNPPLSLLLFLHEHAPPPQVSQLGGLEIYTPLEGAIEKQEHQTTPELSATALEFAGLPHHLAELLQRRPLLLLRYLATPNNEFIRFLALAGMLARPPVVFESAQDRFSPTVNPIKRRLAKIPIALKNGGLRHVRITDTFDRLEGRAIAAIRCCSGQSLPEFHHEMLHTFVGDRDKPDIVDTSGWWFSGDRRTKYEQLFAACTCLGMLAESFGMDEAENAFTEEIILPAFEATIKRFGAPPIIVRLLPPGEEGAVHWDAYPQEVLPLAVKAARA